VISSFVASGVVYSVYTDVDLVVSDIDNLVFMLWIIAFLYIIRAIDLFLLILIVCVDVL